MDGNGQYSRRVKVYNYRLGIRITSRGNTVKCLYFERQNGNFDDVLKYVRLKPFIAPNMVFIIEWFKKILQKFTSKMFKMFRKSQF